MMSLNVSGLFFAIAARLPDRTALIEGRDRLTFRELALAVRQTAQAYRLRGLGKGDRVLILIPMGIALYRNLLALLSLGAVPVFLDEWVDAGRRELCCRIAGCRAFLAPVGLRLLALSSREVRRIPLWLPIAPPRSISFAATRGEKDLGDLSAVELSDPALITFTTGSTGTPKACVRTHGCLRAQFEALTPLVGTDGQGPCLTLLPVVLFLHLALGKTSVLPPVGVRRFGAAQARRLAECLAHHGIRELAASPAVLLALAKEGPRVSNLGRNLTQIRLGGAPVFPEDARLLTEAFPGANILVIYGSTEAEPISHIDARELARRTLTPAGSKRGPQGLPVGKPPPPVEISLIRITDRPVSPEQWPGLLLGPGEVGEICVAGDHVAAYYWNDAEQTARNKVFLSGKTWHRTGDAGVFGPEGELLLLGRCRSLIEHDGRILYPFLIEADLRRITSGRAGTLIRTSRGLRLVIEAKSSQIRASLAQVLAQQSPWSEFKLSFLQRIPRDPRHQSKIDYDRLTQILESSFKKGGRGLR